MCNVLLCCDTARAFHWMACRSTVIFLLGAANGSLCALPHIDRTACASLNSSALVRLQGKRGIFVIEAVGGGLKSRAVIHKGSLHHVARVSAAGTAVTILDDDMRALTDGRYAAHFVVLDCSMMLPCPSCFTL